MANDRREPARVVTGGGLDCASKRASESRCAVIALICMHSGGCEYMPLNRVETTEDPTSSPRPDIAVGVAVAAAANELL